MSKALEQLRIQCKAWGVELDRSQLKLLGSYADQLSGYELANVIGTRDREQIVQEHLVDSLSCLAVPRMNWVGSLIDVGAGGGLPGVPLSIVCPRLHVNLLESLEKKVRFLEQVKAELKLRNLQVLHARAEELATMSKYREAFDLAAARALAALPVVLEYCAPLVSAEGRILAMKGRLEDEELSQGVAAASMLGARLDQITRVDYIHSLPQKERRLAVFDKVDATPVRFPRRVGLAKKRPLGV